MKGKNNPRSYGEYLANRLINEDKTRERIRVIDYLQNIEVDGMRKHLCFSCAFVKLYDKNNREYKISRTQTLKEVQGIIEQIKKVNAV